MWLIVSKLNEERVHVLLCGREYVFGRRDADILLENDMSISRKHAVLRSTHPEQNLTNTQIKPILTLEDFSKLGSAVGDKRIIKDKTIVNSGDTIWFGNLSGNTSQYRALYQPFIVTTSCLDATAKKSTRVILTRLGGHVINEWRKECDILVMCSLSITIKAICALINQKPIVTPKYLEDKLKALEAGKSPRSTRKYLPPLAESQLDPKQVSFDPDARRQKIFQGSLFIFFTSKQFKKLAIAIELGGGTPMLLDDRSEDNEHLLIAPGSCVMSCDLNDQSQVLTKNARLWIEHAMKTLQKRGKRPILECEIGFAVLYCSTLTHCNPDSEDNRGAAVPVTPQTLSQNASVSQINTNSDVQTRKPGGSQLTGNSITMDPSEMTRKSEGETVSFSSGSKKRGRGSYSDEIDTPVKKTRTCAPDPDPEPRRPLPDDALDNNNCVKAKPGNSSRKIPEVEEKRNKPVSDPVRRSTRRSPSPTPNTVPSRSRNTSDPVRRSTRRSPSPTPNPITAPVSPDLYDTGKSVPSRRRNTRSPSPTPNRITAPISPDLYDTGRSSKRARDDSFDENFPSTRTSRKSKMTFDSDEGRPSSGGEDDEFAAIPKRKSRRKHKSASPEPDVVDLPVRVKRENITVIEDSEVMPEPGQKMGPLNQNTKQEPRDVKTEPTSSYELGPSISQRAVTVTGFLSRADHVALPIDDAFIDKDIKPMNMVIEEMSLEVAPPARSKGQGTGEMVLWKGRMVKNFKKFRKVVPAGGDELPEIIGGTDLVAHVNTQGVELDEWFQEYNNEQSQHSRPRNEDDKVNDDEDLFNFEPRRKAGNTRKGRR